MKKILLFVMLLITFSISITTTYAYDPVDPEILGEYMAEYYDFEAQTLSPNYNAYVIEETAIPIDSNILYVTIPADADRVTVANSVDAEISFYDSLTDTWIDYLLDDLLIPGDTITDEIRLTIRFNALASLGSILGDIVLYNFTHFKITLPLAQYATTDEAYYIANTAIYTVQTFYLIQFIDRFEIVANEFILGSSVPTTPVLDAPPEDYVFIGWFAIDQNASGFDDTFIPVETSGPNAYDNLISGYFEDVAGAEYRMVRLYARYKSLVTGDLTGPNFDPTAPDGIKAIFASFGMNNNTGYTLFFMFILIILFMVFAALKLPILIYFVAGVSSTLFFMFFGLLPIFISIVIILLMVIAFFGFNLGGHSYE